MEKGVIDHANDEIKKQIYAKSWDLTSKETQKLFTKVQNMIPHRIRDTASIHDARRIVIYKVPPRLRESSRAPVPLNARHFCKPKTSTNVFVICRKIYFSQNHNFAVRRSLFDHPKMGDQI